MFLILESGRIISQLYLLLYIFMIDEDMPRKKGQKEDKSASESDDKSTHQGDDRSESEGEDYEDSEEML